MSFLTVIPQFFEHEDQITVNAVTAAFSAVYVILGFLGWFMYAHRCAEKAKKGVEFVAILDQPKNYYCYRFAAAPFLDNTAFDKPLEDLIAEQDPLV